MRPYTILLLTALLLLTPLHTSAQWPTTVDENLAVTIPDSLARYPKAMSLADGKTLVVFSYGWIGMCYQIITDEGELVYSEPQPVIPTSIPWDQEPFFLEDEAGGCLVCWQTPDRGIIAQRFDSLGNSLWGDSGSLFYPIFEHDWDICNDGNGGFWFAIAILDDIVDHDDIWLQHIDSEGNVAWGDSGLLIQSSQYGENEPKLAPDYQGGVHVVWDDWEPPYNYWGALFMQRFDSNGSPVWDPPEGHFIYDHDWFHQVIPDGENGFILHCGRGSYNTVYRVDPEGDIVWGLDQVTWYTGCQMHKGEGNYFYFGFGRGSGDGIYAQKMDIYGNTYWPTLGSLEGALMMQDPYGVGFHSKDFAYRFPFFYGVVTFSDDPYYGRNELHSQIMDTLGQRRFSEMGALMSRTQDSLHINRNYAVPTSDGGLIDVYQTVYDDDICAKRINLDGTLGGPLAVNQPDNPPPPENSVTVHGQMIQFSLAQAGDVRLELFNILGQRIEVLDHTFRLRGSYTISFNQHTLPTGIYLLRLRTNNTALTKKVIVLE